MPSLMGRGKENCWEARAKPRLSGPYVSRVQRMNFMSVNQHKPLVEPVLDQDGQTIWVDVCVCVCGTEIMILGSWHLSQAFFLRAGVCGTTCLRLPPLNHFNCL